MEEKKLTGYPSIDKPWLKYYTEEAINAPLPKCTIYEYLFNCNKDNQDTVAVSYFGKKITYGQLFQQIDLTAEKLKGIGVKEGDMVVIMSLNTPESICLLYAINKVGAVSDWVYFTKSTTDLIAKVRSTSAQWLFSIDLPELDWDELAKECKKIVRISIFESMPIYLKVAMQLKNKKIKSTASNVITWKSFMSAKGEACAKAIYKIGKPAAIVHTGGTTGIPKGVMLSDDNLNSVGFQARQNEMGLARGKRVLHAIPMFMAYGLALSTHLPLTNGMTLLTTPNPDQTKGGQLIRKYHPYAVLAGPAFVEGLVADEKIKNKDLAELGILLVGGESLSNAREEYANNFLQSHGSSARLQNGYGASETAAFGTICMNRGRIKAGSIGIPNSQTTISLFDPDTGKECKYFEEGEICIASQTVMLGYYNNEDATNAVIRTHDGYRWMHTGDIGYMDTDGFLFFRSRIKKLYVIKSKADGSQYKVFPSIIEESIEKVNGIATSCVICTPDAEWINRVIAYVQLEEGHNKSEQLIGEILQQCTSDLPVYDIPSEIRFIKQIPLTTAEKKDYRALEKQAQEQETLQ